MSTARGRASAKYNAKTYDRIVYTVHKGIKDQLADYADHHGVSVNALIGQALRELIARDNPDVARDIFGD
jgi:predicted HicB family RNase H-like nuclease